jgi:hypothetical protein
MALLSRMESPMPVRSSSLLVSLAWLVLLLSAGCATPPDGGVTPRLTRLSSEEMARLAPDAPGLSLDDLLVMARSGVTAEVMIARFRQSGARFDLSPLQVVDLHQRGLPLPVLQAIHEDREKALRTDLTQRLVDRDQQCAGEIAQAQSIERQRALASVGPFWPGCYGAWGATPYRRPGAFLGW